MLMRWVSSFLICLAVTLFPGPVGKANFASFQNSNNSGVTTFATLKVGGGGFVTGFSMTSDGTKLARTDTYGVYLFNTGTSLWNQLVTFNSMPATDQIVDGATNGYGVYEAVIAPSNTAHFYMNYNGYVYSSTNSGALWTRTSFTRDTTANTSDNYRVSGKMMAVDPANEAIVFAGTPTGLFKTANSGTSWATDSGVTAPTVTDHGGVLVAFDPSSTVTGGVTQGVYACSYGRGVYHTTNGGSSWALTSGTPTTCNHLIVDAAGIAWLIDDANGNTQGNLKKFSAGSWSTALGSSNNLHSVAVDPANGAHVYASDSGSQLYVSVNTGGSFVGKTAITVTAPDIPWLAAAALDGQFSNGDIQFDPAGANLLYNANGIGIFKTNPPTTNTTVTWTSQTANVENLDMNRVVGSNSNNKPLISAWDRAGFIVVPGTYPSAYGGSACSGALGSGWSGDVDPTGATAAVLSTPTPGTNCGTSSSTSISSVSWSAFASQTPETTNSTVGGCFAASTTTHFLWLPDDNGSNANGPWTSTNGGTTWTARTVANGTSATAPTGWGENYFNPAQPCAADRVTVDTYYLWNDGQRASGDKGIYKSTDGGVTWSKPFAGNFGGGFGGNIQLKAVPGNAGHLFFSVGNQGVGNHPASTQLWHSTDAGATWTALANTGETFCVGFGATFAGQSYPAIYFVGWLSNVYGVWRSIDNFATTPVKIGDGFPGGSIDPIKDCDGDGTVIGNMYMVTGGNGAYYGHLN